MYFVKTPFLFKRILPKAIWDLYTTDPILYLTFDDGPVPETTPWVLSTLKEYNAKATFFCVGENVRKHSALFHELVNGGHSIGNHTFNHLNGWKTSTDKYLENVRQCREITFPLFRPPYGRLKLSQYQRLLPEFTIVMWDVLSGDFDEKLNGEDCFKNVKNNAQKGSVIVFHDSIKAFPRLKTALPKVLKHFSKKGFRFEAIRL